MKIINNLIQNLKTLLYNFNLSGNIYYYIIFILFLLIAYFMYTKFIIPKISSQHVLNKEIELSNYFNSTYNNVIILLFKTEWCPYCMQIEQNEWKNFKKYVDKLNNDRDNNKKISLLTVDCDKQSELCNKYNIKEYPTIKLISNKVIYDYNAKTELNTLIEFLEPFL